MAMAREGGGVIIEGALFADPLNCQGRQAPRRINKEPRAPKMAKQQIPGRAIIGRDNCVYYMHSQVQPARLPEFSLLQ